MISDRYSFLGYRMRWIKCTGCLYECLTISSMDRSAARKLRNFMILSSLVKLYRSSISLDNLSYGRIRTQCDTITIARKQIVFAMYKWWHMRRSSTRAIYYMFILLSDRVLYTGERNMRIYVIEWGTRSSENQKISVKCQRDDNFVFLTLTIWNLS